MGKHLNPLEKEFLIRQYRRNPGVHIIEFCAANHISDTAFRQWLRQYDQNGLAGLARADAKFKKNYTVQTNEAGEPEYIRLKPKNLK